MKLWLLHIMLLMAVAVFGQEPLDSVQRIDTVTVKPVWSSSAVYQKPPQNQQVLNGDEIIQYQSTTLGEILQENTGIYIKTYGPGSLATSGFRGMGASQTKVFWNGIPINSGMNGTIDLTNLPVALFDNIKVAMGGNSMENASGSMGGDISVSSHAPLPIKHWAGAVGYEAGSFGEHTTVLKLEQGSKRIQSKAGFVYRRARNDFPFTNTTLFGGPEQKQEHAEFEQYAGLLELNYRMKSRKLSVSNLSLQSFASKTGRNIPPTMLSANAFQSQYDWLALAKLQWLGTAELHNLQASVTYKFDEINFTSELPVIDSRSQTHSLFANLSDHWFVHRSFAIGTRLEHISQWAVTNNFNGVKYQPLTALMISPEYRYLSNRVIVKLILRQELVYNKLSPFLPSLTVRYEPFSIYGLQKQQFYLYTNIFRNYRYPTLNDRYWSVGGNPDLQQEKGWGAEGKVGYDKNFKKGPKLETSVNAYYLDVNNWILWLPESSTGIWTPENVRRVKSRGVEVLVKLDGKKNDWTYRFTANYHFNKATNETTGGSQGASTGKILIYTPQHLGNVSGMAGYKGYYIQYRQHLCGKRFITSDNSQSLDAFTTGALRVGKDFGKKLKGLSLYVAAENLWNAQYQNIAWRPMPGRGFSGGIRYEFKIEN